MASNKENQCKIFLQIRKFFQQIFLQYFEIFEVKLLMGRDERELFFVHSVLLDHFRVVLSDRFVFIHNSNIDLIVYISKSMATFNSNLVC